jgi:hypothetical protein
LPTQVFSGSITTSDPTETNRLTRNQGTGSTCGVLKAFPGTQAGTFHYDAYTFTNPSASTVCISVNLTNSCTNNVFTEAYSPSFNPASLLRVLGMTNIAKACRYYAARPALVLAALGCPSDFE